ncbi:hypothetical protein D9M69_485620 [compost metagenome]
MHLLITVQPVVAVPLMQLVVAAVLNLSAICLRVSRVVSARTFLVSVLTTLAVQLSLLVQSLRLTSVVFRSKWPSSCSSHSLSAGSLKASTHTTSVAQLA